MRKLLSPLLISLLVINASAQEVKDILHLSPDSVVTGIKVQTLGSDKNSTSFIIWIKESVKAHKHLTHSENIYVLEGEGEMKINNNLVKLMPGDYVFIPENTVHSVKVTSTIPMKVLSVQSPEFLGDDRVLIDE